MFFGHVRTREDSPWSGCFMRVLALLSVWYYGMELNFIGILTGCRVLNFLYQLDISLIEVFFIYTLKLAHGGRLSVSAQIPRLQFVTRLPDSPKTEVKGVIFVRGPWYETLGSPDLPFTLN